jgi:hypothetical protein
LLSALPLAATWLFLRNNVLVDDAKLSGVRLGGGLALLAVILPVAGELKARRPPWPWARSLPWSSRRRVVQDAMFLGAAALPPLAVAAWFAPAALLPLAFGAVFQVAHVAGVMRRDVHGITRLGRTVIGEMGLVTLTIAATGWAAVVWLALCPWTLAEATRNEQARKVSLWSEQQPGNPMS